MHDTTLDDTTLDDTTLDDTTLDDTTLDDTSDAHGDGHRRRNSRALRIVAALDARLGVTLAAAAAATALLLVPFLTMAPDTAASTEPGGDVFVARDRIDEQFASHVRPTFFVIEDPDGDLLRAEPLARLLAGQQALRDDPTLGATLVTYFDADVGRDVVGTATLADLVDAELRSTGTTLADATDTAVKAAGTAVIERYGARSDLLGLSSRSYSDTAGDWVVPAITATVLSDDTVLGFGAVSVNLGGDTAPEEYARDLQDVLRSTDLRVHGVAIDVNLTSAEQGAVAGPFIGFTIMAVLLMIGLTFRSYWILATVSSAFIGLIVWLKGISNLIGLNDDLVLSLIVPIAMISFGVDFAFHAVGRYREERATGLTAGPAVVAGLAAVSAALTLALTSDTVAFLSNVTSGIESIVQFGVGAAIALVSAYLLLGVLTPLVVARIERDVPPPRSTRAATVLRVAGAAAATGATMTTVLLLVFVNPALGAGLAAVTISATSIVPYLWQRSRLGDRPAVGAVPTTIDDHRWAGPIGRLVHAVARRPAVVLPVAAVLTGSMAVLAVGVPAEFDIEDFFSADTDFVVGLELLDTHLGDRGGEPALLYVEGDLDDPSALAAVANRIDEIRSLETPSLARDESGFVSVRGGVFEVFDAALGSPAMATLIARQTGVDVFDRDGDGIPDTTEQVRALIATASLTGVPVDAERLALTPDDVTSAVRLDGDVGATAFELGLVDSRTQESVTAARDALDPIAASISADLGGTFVQVTGSPFVREASLQGARRALQISLPIAVLACLVVSASFLRSIRYGLASVVPILMVVSWLYGFMRLAGFAINLVTATIAAVSIGVGIDFAVHFIARFREELARTGDRAAAALATGEGTGLALVASAASSAIGFGILAFAPMPLFATYGLLTAVMITMALVATLVVLPSLLMLITTDAPTEPGASHPTGAT